MSPEREQHMNENASQNALWNKLQLEHADQAIYRRALDYAGEYLAAQRERPPFPTPAALAALDQFDEALSAGSIAASDVLATLHRIGTPATTALNGGRYFGFVNGGVLPAALAARLLAVVWDQNAGLQIMSPIAAKLEAVCETWLVDLFDLPADTAMGLVSGTSVATLCGLLAARNAILGRAGWDVSDRGLFNAPPLRAVMSGAAHVTVRKALAILGIGTAQIELVPADDQGRFDAGALPPLDERTILILQAGNVNSGAFDPFLPLCQAANAAGAWTHIDGAFGLWARACASTAGLTAGIELADSWSVDAHKTLNAPYDCGIVLCRDRAALTRALQASDSYIPPSQGRDGMLYTPEMSRRARGIELWAALKSLGRSGIDQLVAQLCRRACQFAAELEAQGFLILNDVVFNQVLVACETPALTVRTLAQLQAGGECWCGGTEWRGEPAIRISVCSWATSEADVARSAAAIVWSRTTARDASG